MTSVKIPKGHTIHVCSYASTTLTTAATDLTIEATVLPPVRVKLATVSKVDAERLKAARLRSKQDRDAIVALIEEEARMFKSADPHLIVASCDASVSHVIGLELEHLARKVRPVKQEPSMYIRGELVRRYGTDVVEHLMDLGHTIMGDKGDITIEVQPWLAWWRTGNETRYCEIVGAIEDFVPCVRVAVDTIGAKDYHTMGATAGGEYVEIPRLDVLGVTYEEHGCLVTLETSTAARLGWT